MTSLRGGGVVVLIPLVSLSPYSVFCITLDGTRRFTRRCTFYISLAVHFFSTHGRGGMQVVVLRGP